MENKQKTKPEGILYPWQKEEEKQFNYGDVYIWCGNCGSDNATHLKNLQTALVTQTTCDNQGVLALVCKVCGSHLALHFRESMNPPETEVVENFDEAKIKKDIAEEVIIETPQQEN
jgi:hypothetical protein